MRWLGTLLVGILTATLLSVTAATAQAAPVAVDCQSCHDQPKEWAARKNVHAPVQAKECLACHNPHASRHGGLIRQKAARVCLSCHEDLTEKARGEGAHAPIGEESSCISCHDPHASDRESLLVESPPALCVTCHDEIPGPQESGHPHAPAAGGECLTCHDPHGGENAGLAVAAQPDLCIGCHEVGGAQVRKAHGEIPVTGSDCSSCHAPHGSNLPNLIRLNTHVPFGDGTCEVCHEDPAQPAAELRAAAGDLCMGCHEPHDGGHPVPEGEACVSCHSPHTSSGVALIARSEREICTTCHLGIGTRQESAESVHPELEKGQNCSICHGIHEGFTRVYLKKTDPLSTCISCHQSHQEFAHPMGRGVIDLSRKGQSVDCVSCHNPHGTAFPKMLVADRRRDLCVRCHASGDMGAGLGSGH